MGDEVIEQKPRRIGRRPDGTNEEDYAKVEGWPPKRWAWEFLRRNRAFAKESKVALGQGKEEQDAVAEKYGLKRFKPANEGYRGAHGLPLFASGYIRSRTNLDDPKRQIVKVPLREKQMIILFDLEQMMINRSSMRAQVDLAQQRISKRLSELEAKFQKKANQHRPHWHAMKDSLRLLDLLDVAKLTPLDCFLLLDKALAKEFEKDERKGVVRKQIHSKASERIRRAREFTKDGYLQIAVMVDREK